MSTTTVKTIGASGADYTVLQTWEDAAPANLTTSIAGGEIWQGQIKAASDVFTSATNLLTIAGSTTNSSGYKELTTATGASFADNANVQTNALRYNASNGCAITLTGSYAAAVSLGEDFFRMSKVQIAATGGSQSRSLFDTLNSGSATMDFNQCIIEHKSASGGSASGVYLAGASVKVRNSLIVQRIASATNICRVDAGASLYNCTVACCTTAATTGIEGKYGTTVLKNVGVFGATAPTGLTSTFTVTTSYTDNTATGWTTTAFATGSGAKFTNITDGTHDFRPQSGSSLLDVGTTDSTNAAKDIVGTSRPQGSAYDVGCWELVVSAGGVFGSYFYRQVAGRG